MRESAVERKFREGIKARGGYSIKSSTAVAGMPDRIVCMPHRPAMLVELKKDGGEIEPIQVVWHGRFADIGHPVHLVIGSAGVEEFFQLLDEVDSLHGQ